ncbi:hypothetical protein Y032_0819g2521 [Ancylostoma ceylanicum]|uniref:Uncharacterized protein n=1 Tax=Ancylostoma ceylanicum TaxID=53326 RepID=A0A016WBF2_9BILA|nr:hypothetical protein Y032_0819g2521 [Ancylostoma ceylanicum]
MSSSLLHSSTESGWLQNSSSTTRTKKPDSDKKIDVERRELQPKPYWAHVGCKPIFLADQLRVRTSWVVMTKKSRGKTKTPWFN